MALQTVFLEDGRNVLCEGDCGRGGRLFSRWLGRKKDDTAKNEKSSPDETSAR
jgi:hypothetical protein